MPQLVQGPVAPQEQTPQPTDERHDEAATRCPQADEAKACRKKRHLRPRYDDVSHAPSCMCLSHRRDTLLESDATRVQSHLVRSTTGAAQKSCRSTVACSGRRRKLRSFLQIWISTNRQRSGAPIKQFELLANRPNEQVMRATNQACELFGDCPTWCKPISACYHNVSICPVHGPVTLCPGSGAGSSRDRSAGC